MCNKIQRYNENKRCDARLDKNDRDELYQEKTRELRGREIKEGKPKERKEEEAQKNGKKETG